MKAHGLGDLNDLALPHAQTRDDLAGIDFNAHLVQQPAGLFVGLFPVDDAALFRHTSEENVLRDRQAGHKAHFLIDRGEAACVGVAGGVEVQLFVVQIEAAARGPDGAGEALDQGRLAGTVFSEKRVDLAAFKADRDLIQRETTRVLFADAFRSQYAHIVISTFPMVQ